MVELIDSPFIAPHKVKRSHYWVWVVVTATLLIVACVGRGKAALIPVGNAQGLDVKIDFRGYDKVADGGSFFYGQGKTVTYHVIVTNTGNSTLTDLEMQSMIQGIKTRLPGDVISPEHKTSLTPGQSYRFTVRYEVPSVEKAEKANLVVHAKYKQHSTYKSDSFLCPTSLKFE